MDNGVEWDEFEMEWKSNEWMERVENRMDQKLDLSYTKSEYILIAALQHYSMLYQLFRLGHV